MIKRRSWLLAICLLVAACAPPDTAPGWPSAPTASPPTDPSTAPSETAVVLLPEPPDTLNPLYARSWSARAVQDLFLVGLWRVDDRLGLLPELAAEIPTLANGGISADGQTLTIHLRSDVTWSDGQPLTAADVVFTHRMVIAEGNHPVSRFPYDTFVDTVEALDTHTVQIHLSRPFAPWPTTIFTFVLPQHVLEPVFALEGTLDRAVWNRNPTVGSGPFVFTGREGEELLFAAHPGYWRGGLQIEHLRVQALADPAARWTAVALGQADLAPFLWPEVGSELLPPAGVHLLASPSGYVETLFFNLDPHIGHPALQNPAVRAALAQALDRRTICEALPGSWAEPATTLWSGTVVENLALEIPLPDPAAAAERLYVAGWQDSDGDGAREREGVTLLLRYAVQTGAVDRSAAQTAVAQTWSAVGVDMSIVPSGPQALWDNPATWDVAQWADQPPGYPDPDDPRWLCVEARPGGNNPAAVCDEELDRLIVAQARAVDPDQRAALLIQTQQLAQERVWWVPLCRWEDRWAVSDRLRGPQPWRGAPFWNAWEWSLNGP